VPLGWLRPIRLPRSSCAWHRCRRRGSGRVANDRWASRACALQLACPEEAELSGALIRPRGWLRTARTCGCGHGLTQCTLEDLRRLPVPLCTLEAARIRYAAARFRISICARRAMKSPLRAASRVRARRSHAERGAAPVVRAGAEADAVVGCHERCGTPLFDRAISDKSLAGLTRFAIRRARHMGAQGLSAEYHLVKAGVAGRVQGRGLLRLCLDGRRSGGDARPCLVRRGRHHHQPADILAQCLAARRA